MERIMMSKIERIWWEQYKDFIDLNDFCNLFAGMGDNLEDEINCRMDSLLSGHVLTLKSA